MQPGRAIVVVLALATACARGQRPPSGGAVAETARARLPASGVAGREDDGPAIVRQALAVRGGPIPTLVRESEVEVAVGFPGAWRWRTVTALPERYAWTIATNDRPHHYLFDGRTVRAFVGDALVSEEPAASSPLATHARFAAVAGLDVLGTAGVDVARSSTADAVTLDVVFRDRGDRYEIVLDRELLVARVTGPIDLSPIARGTVVATYGDYRRAGGRRVAHHIHYELDGTALADERVARACVVETVPPEAFVSPARIPACP